MTLVSLVLAPRFAKIYDTPKLQKNGFDETGVIIGAVIFIVVFPAMFCMQARFNARNDKARKLASASSTKAALLSVTPRPKALLLELRTAELAVQGLALAWLAVVGRHPFFLRMR